MGIRIKLWGTRGSLPAPHSPQALEARIKNILEIFIESGCKNSNEIPQFLSELPQHALGGFGGNTPCAQILSQKTNLIIDAGSGIRNLGYELMGGPCGTGEGEIHLLFTHFHWDHLIGLPFFTPIFVPGNKLHVYAVQPELPDVFKTLFKKPYFPVPLKDLGAQIIYHSLQPREAVFFDDISVTPYQLDHPDPCWGYKIESGNRRLAYCVDTECTRVSHQQLGKDLPLYQGAHLMIFDAQYTISETMEKINWGHAAASIGLDIAMREGIERVLFMHHDPASSDEKVAIAEAEARRYYTSQLKEAKRKGKKSHSVDWSFAQEGMVVEV